MAAAIRRNSKGDAIDSGPRRFLINAYDNLCNPSNIAHALTPMKFSAMFAQQRNRYDPRFSPGLHPLHGRVSAWEAWSRSRTTPWAWSSGSMPAGPLRPSIIVHDAGIPKNEAIIPDLNEEPDSTSPGPSAAQLPAAAGIPEPRRRVSYYFDPNASPQALDP